MIQIYVILKKKLLFCLYVSNLVPSSAFCFLDPTWRDWRIFKKTRGAGDEIGMFPKEESHVQVMIFF